MLLGVYCAMGEHAQDGDLSNVSNPTIEEWAGWLGFRGAKPGVFAQAFTEIFLDENRVHQEFQTNQGKLIEWNKKSRERMARKRAAPSESTEKFSRTGPEHFAKSSYLRNKTLDETPTAVGEAEAQEKRQAEKSPPVSRGLAMRIFGNIRRKRVATNTQAGGVSYRIPKEDVDQLDSRSRAALEGVGGAGIVAVADERQLPVLRGQFAEIFLASE
jgi:hypothetical protein